jgi:hypothetical protein
MGPKRDKTMLLVACAVSARTMITGCSDNHGCMGFYPSDATFDGSNDGASSPDTSGCFGFYPCDANCTPIDATTDADANDANDAHDADGGAGE